MLPVTWTSKKAIGNFYCTMQMNSPEKQCVTVYCTTLPRTGTFGSHSIGQKNEGAEFLKLLRKRVIICACSI